MKSEWTQTGKMIGDKKEGLTRIEGETVAPSVPTGRYWTEEINSVEPSRSF